MRCICTTMYHRGDRIAACEKMVSSPGAGRDVACSFKLTTLVMPYCDLFCLTTAWLRQLIKLLTTAFNHIRSNM